MSKLIGFTTSIPVEMLYAASCKPVDLNNNFINSEDPQSMVSFAEQQGFPRNSCSWIKGIYASVVRSGIDTVIGVMTGDCSQTQILSQILEDRGIEVIPFCYPYDRNIKSLEAEMDKLRVALGTTWERINECKAYLDRIRAKVALIDESTWKSNLVHGFENHLFLITCSDFKGDPRRFEEDIDTFLKGLHRKVPLEEYVRLGFIGVPPIFSDLYDFCESVGGRVVFNETQRQFSMPYKTRDIIEQYIRFTYPYPIMGRLMDIETQIEKRDLDGIIHYCQSFCFRNIEGILFHNRLKIPILTIEGDYPGRLDARTKIRVESFIEMLGDKKEGKII